MKIKAELYIAIIISLSLHVLILIWLNYVNALQDENGDTPEYAEFLDIDLMEIVDFPEIENNEVNPEDLFDEKIKDIIANMESEKSSNINSYNYSNNRALSEEAERKIREEERKLQEEAHETNNIDNYENRYDKDDSENNDSNSSESGQDTSYEGPVSVSYSLKDRNHKSLPKPTYRCKVRGKVSIDIEVNYQGIVTKASINEGATNTNNECLRNEALEYASRSTFNSALNAPRKQNGSIVYIYSAQ